MYYFGFVPSKELYQNIQTLYQLIDSKVNENYTPYRDNIVRLTSQELINTMLIQLIQRMPDNSDRKQRLIALSNHIESTSDKLIGKILTPVDNAQVLPSVEFFNQHILKYHHDSMKICFPLSDRLASDFFACFDEINQGNVNIERLSQIFSELSQACLQHFLVDFTKTLPLNTFKKGAVSLTNGVLEKAIAMALRHLLPQLPEASLQHFVSHYHAQIFRL